MSIVSDSDGEMDFGPWSSKKRKQNLNGGLVITTPHFSSDDLAQLTGPLATVPQK